MFGKKILSVVSVLFLGSKIAIAAAVPRATGAITIDACDNIDAGIATTPCGGSATATTLCIKDNKIYSYDNSEATCNTGTVHTLSSSLNVVSQTTDTTVIAENLSGTPYSDGTKLAIFDCDASTCKQTYGYVTDGTTAYEVSYNGVSKAATVNESVESATDCSGKVGNLIKYIDKVYLCIDVAKSVELKNDGTGENYLMANENGNIFSAAESADYPKLVVKQGAKAITFNNLYTDEEYCVYDSNLIMSRIDQFCVGNILDNLYNCDEGKCQVTGSPIGAGSYIVEEKNGDLGLYTCTGTGTGPVNCEKDNGSLNGIKVVSDTKNEEGYTFLKTVDENGLKEIDDEKLAAAKLKLYDCINGECVLTDGFIQYGGSLSSRALCTSDEVCTAAAGDLTVEGVAKIYYTNLEVYDIDDSSKTSKLFTIEVGNEYFYKKEDNKIVLIRTVSNSDVQQPKVMVVGIAKYYGEKIIAGMDKIVVPSCTANTQTTYTITGNSVTASTKCVVKSPCDLEPSDAQHCEEGFYLKEASGGLATATGTNTGTLYECKLDTVMKCGEAKNVGTGLYRNADNYTEGRPAYISCTGEVGNCKGVTATEVTTDKKCNDAGIGGIIIYGEYEKLCLTDDATDAKTVLLYANDGTTTDGGKQFFISISNNNAFGNGSGKYALIDVSTNKVLKNESETTKYRYTNADFKVRYRNDQNDVCYAGVVSATIYEYILNDKSTHVYDEGKSKEIQ